MADSSGNDQSYTVRGFTFSPGSGGGAGSDHYRLRNVTGGTASLIFEGSVDPAFLKFSNTYTGSTTLSNGTLLLGASERIADSSNLIFNGGTLNTGGFSETMGTLLLSDTSSIDLGSGDSDLSFLDSSALSWTEATTLNISNFDEGVDSIRFGADASGLSSSQLAQNTLNGGTAYIDGSGYLTTVPEAGSFALLGGLLALSSVAMRRRK